MHVIAVVHLNGVSVNIVEQVKYLGVLLHVSL